MSETNFYKIGWETDGETVELPEYAYGDAETLADALSDEHGWLVQGLTPVPFDFEGFVDGYIEAILWTDAWPVHADPDHPDYYENWESGGLDDLDVSDATRAAIIEAAQLREFVVGNLNDLLLYVAACRDGTRDYHAGEGTPETWAGHDFYLTRAGHGCGFWDRGLGALGDRLTEACKSAGSVDDHTLYDNGDGTASL